MTFKRKSQGPLTHCEAWQKAEDQLRTEARLVWGEDRQRAADLIEAADKVREDRLSMSFEYAEQC